MSKSQSQKEVSATNYKKWEFQVHYTMDPRILDPKILVGKLTNEIII